MSLDVRQNAHMPTTPFEVVELRLRRVRHRPLTPAQAGAALAGVLIGAAIILAFIATRSFAS